MERKFQLAVVAAIALAALAGCASDRVKNEAKEAAAKYWSDKAYPGKSFDVQVIDAEKGDDGMYHVKGIVDGETRVGTFDPNAETFSEGYYSLAHEREKHIAELEQEVKYWKEKADSLDKEIYKLKVRLNLAKGKGPDGEEMSGGGADGAKAHKVDSEKAPKTDSGGDSKM